MKIFNFKEYRLRNYDLKMVILIGILCVVGYFVLSSAIQNEVDAASTLRKQLLGVAIGTGFMAVLSVMDYHFILKITPMIYLAILAMLVGVLIFGVNVNNATRWVKIAGIQIQPSEFTKVGLIVIFAALFWVRRETISRPLTILMSLAVLGIPCFLIYKEPDLSTTIVCVFIFVCMIYVARISYKWIFAAVGGVAATLSFIVFEYVRTGKSLLLKDYQITRILAWIDPAEYAATGLTTQQDNSVLAISSGQLLGKGLNNTSFESVKNGNFLSEENCDFIFAVIGEELGFVGSIVVLVLMALLVIECFRIASIAKDLSGKMIAIGYGSLLAFQTFVNVGVASGLLPNTGLPLPFISAGVSSLMSLFIGAGVVLNVALQRKIGE